MTRRRHTREASTRSTPEEILADFLPDVRALAGALRALILRTIPTASEHAYSGWRGIGYRHPQSGYFCGIFPQRDHVKLGFEYGAALPDPDRMPAACRFCYPQMATDELSKLLQPGGGAPKSPSAGLASEMRPPSKRG
jgi:hypothetical protein